MFTDFTVALLVGIGFGGWVYSRIYRKTGGNSQNGLIVGAVSGIVALVAVMTILGLVFD
jgi:hypothetical protein